MAASVKTEDLKKAIKNILEDADLDSLSAKKVRRKLEEMFEIDFTERKKEIDEITMNLITEVTVKEDVKEAKLKPSAKSKVGQATQNGSKKKEVSHDDASENSSDLSEVEDAEPVVKKRKLKVKPDPKTTSGSDGSDMADEVDDAQLAKQLQQEENRCLRTRRRPNKKPPAPRKNKDKKERKGKSMYSRPCQLSADLAEVIGADQMSRHEIVKKMWEIMRERELQDQKNRQFMICDEQLQKVFGRKRIRMFGMMKYLTKHIRGMDELVD